MASLFGAEIHVTCNYFWDKEGFRIPFQDPSGSSLAPHTPGMLRALHKDRRTKEVPGIPPHRTLPSSRVSFPLHASFLQPPCCWLLRVSSLLRGLPSLSFILQGSCWVALPKGGWLYPSLVSSPLRASPTSRTGSCVVSQRATGTGHRLENKCW